MLAASLNGEYLYLSTTTMSKQIPKSTWKTVSEKYLNHLPDGREHEYCLENNQLLVPNSRADLTSHAQTFIIHGPTSQKERESYTSLPLLTKKGVIQILSSWKLLPQYSFSLKSCLSHNAINSESSILIVRDANSALLTFNMFCVE